MNGQGDDQYLSVRETAALLKVHENTVRNWARDGVLVDARLPGTRFLRFNRSDVERLRDRRGSTTVSLKDERQTVGPELVNATQLALWANTVASRALFPELIRRLLAATPGVTAIDMRAGDGVDLAGWDGSAESDGTSFLPKGSLRFEFGVNKKFKAKADEDWSKRTTSRRQPETFVFATPRRWPDGQKWAGERRAQKKFRNVRVLDGDTLEGWLQQTPSVHHWISEQVGRQPSHARTSDLWWSTFSASTTPQLPKELFLAGRDEQAEQLNRLLGGQPRAITLRAEWFNDAVAFAHAATNLPTTNNVASAPMVIVDSSDVFLRIAQQPGRVTLVPTFQNADIATAAANGHHVILIVDDSLSSSGRPDIDLPRPDRQLGAKAFEGRAVEFRDAQRFAAHARRNLQAFVRSISNDSRIARPFWAQPPIGDQSARLVLVGSWVASDADNEVLSKLLDRSDAEIDDLLMQVSEVDPVFRRTGDHWAVTSPREAFDVLAPVLAARPALLDRWIAIAVEILSEPDPVLDMPEDERTYAGIRGVHRRTSPTMRRGLAQGLALLGALGGDFTSPNGSTLANAAEKVVRQLLATANADATGRAWREISDILPLLAEAAPQEFLEALNSDLATSAPIVSQLFDEPSTNEPSSFGSFSPHTHLLWAIENVGWSPDYLLDATRALVRLTELDPGGRTSNRPASSLSTMLYGWVNNTSASHAERLAAVTFVQAHDPDACWSLVLSLLPSDHSVSFPPHYPSVRRWLPTATVKMSDWVSYTSDILDIALDLVKKVSSRIGKLVETMGTVIPADRIKILAELDRIASDPGRLSPSDQLDLWEQLRGTIGRHERFPGAQWSFDSETLDQLRLMADKLEPQDDPKRFAYLFDWHPDVPGLPDDDYAAYDQKLEELREAAISTLAPSGDLVANLALITSQAPAPAHVGFTMSKFSQVRFEDLLSWLGSEERSLVEAAGAWVAQKLRGDDDGFWLRQSLQGKNLRGTARSVFLRSVPIHRAFWAVIDENPADADFWWTNVYPRFVQTADVDAVVTRLLKHGRPMAAVEVLASAMRRPEEAEDGLSDGLHDLIISTLEAAITQEPRAEDISSMTGYYIGQLLDYLEASGTDDQIMARLEFAFFRLLQHTRQPKVLETALANEAEFFVDLAKRVYRGKNQQPGERDVRETQLAQQAWWVLNGWSGFPGRTDDGGSDATVLQSWITTARLLFSESDRADIGDELIGQTFAHAPLGRDGIWPAEPFRDIIETIGSQNLENGVILGRFNSRGVTTRGPYEGGRQERALANQYREWSQAVKAQSPRTARILRLLAEDYDREARREDVRAEIEADSD